MEGLGGSLLFFLPMIAMFYLILFIPEKKRRKKYAAMIDALKVNDEIMTKGGIMGKIVKLGEDYIVLESGPDRARLKFSKNAIGTVTASKDADEVE